MARYLKRSYPRDTAINSQFHSDYSGGFYHRRAAWAEQSAHGVLLEAIPNLAISVGWVYATGAHVTKTGIAAFWLDHNYKGMNFHD